MFGIKFIKEKDWEVLREEVSLQKRQLEDVGWINVSLDPASTANSMFADGFRNMIKNCRMIYYKNPLAGLWVHLTTSFVFGEGISTPKCEDPAIQEVVDEFWNDPDNKKSLTSFMAQQLISNKLQYEGNLFFLLFDDEEGSVKVRVLNTDEVDDIITDRQDRMRANYYKVRSIDRKFDFMSNSWHTSNNQFVYYPACDIYDITDYNGPRDKLKDEARLFHVKINCDINDKFGVPELYRGNDWVRAHKDMNEDIATLVKALSQFAWKKKVKGTQAQVNSIAGAMQSKMNLSNLKQSAGQMQVENESVDLQSIDVKTGGLKIGVDGSRQMKLMVCAASGIYEHYFGDPSTGNLATSKSMELPMIKKFVTYQSLWTDIYLGILNYLIDRKIEVGILPGEMVEDPKHKRRTFKTDLDRSIDIDFPPILEEDLKNWADALKVAQDGNLITQESAAKLFMLAANMNNIDEEMDKLALEVSKKKAEQKEIFKNKVPFGPPQADQKVKQDVKEVMDVKETIGMPKKRIEMRSKKKENYVLQRMAGYRKSLAGCFRTFVREVKENMAVVSTPEGGYVGHVNKFYDAINRLKHGMNDSAEKYFPIAIEIGEKFMQSNLKDMNSSIKIEETLYEAEGSARSILNKRLLWNQHYIESSLENDIMKSFEDTVRKTYGTEAEFKEAMTLAMLKYESRVEQYVGAFWTVEQDAVKEAGRGTNTMVNFVGPEDEHNCEGCERGVEGNPWKIEEAPVPGEQQCMGRCRHALQIA